MIGVAIDENVENVRAFMEGITYPVLIDADHVLTELYAISNVPTVMLIDENDHIVQPNWNAFASDTFREITGIDSGAQLRAIRDWVVDGTPLIDSDEAKQAVGDLSDDEQQAKLLFRIANHLRRSGDDDGARRVFDRAAASAPHDWTVRRAMLPLTGGDPFGQGYVDLAAEFTAAGRPYHGIAPDRSA